jgi:hypothetical protein
MEERQKGVASGVTSAQLHIIKEALEQMKSYYLQLFMDRDLALKFVEDKEREVEELCYQLSLACSSSLTTETPSSLVVVTHEGMSGTHDLREEPLVTIPHEEHSELQVLEERYDAEGFDYALVFHCGDHELFLLESPLKAQGLAMEEIVEHIPCGPTRKEVYASMDWVDRYMTDMGMLWDTGSGDTSRVMDTVAPTGYMMVQDDSVIGNNMQGYSLAHGSVQWSFGVFPPGRPPDRVLKHTIELRLPKISEWMGEPQGATYPSMIDLHLGYHQMRAREQGYSQVCFQDFIMISWSCPWG